MSNDTLLTTLYTALDEQSLLEDISSLLGWDQSVMMPRAGAEGRARQRGLLARLLHQRKSEPAFLELVDTLAERIEELDADDAVNVRELKRNCDRDRKLSTTFIERRTTLASQAYAVWQEARPQNDFSLVEPLLEQVVALQKEEAELVGYEEHPYDALLDKFEPHARISQVRPLLERLAHSLKDLLPQVTARQQTLPPPRGASLATQQQLCQRLAEAVGFSSNSGRLDSTAHPFASTLGAGDFRITARYQEDNYLPALFVTLHEAGHALYEMGLRSDQRGRPLGDAVSLGIHESQSLLWEDILGRSRPFLAFLLELSRDFLQADECYPDVDALWLQVNHVTPSLIRVDADEVSYALHILIRMELEVGLIEGTLSVSELPGTWRDLYQQHLGIVVPNDSDGVLQDVHWFHGAIGYFPTYALGKLYAAMFVEKLFEQVPDLNQQIRNGDFTAVRNWLGTAVHSQGQRYHSTELVERVCGAPVHEKAFLHYLQNKYVTER